MDDGSTGFSVFILLLLLLIADYFAVCETAFAGVNRVRLKTAADRGDRRAVRALEICDHFERAITTILIGTNIVHLTASAYVTVLVTRRFGLAYVTVGTLVTTLAVFFAGEMLPKSIAKKYSERFALGTAESLYFFMLVFRPVSAALTAVGSFIARCFGEEHEVSVTESELYDLIENMTDEGELDEDQGELVNHALSFGECTVERIATARVDLAAVDIAWDAERVLSFVRAQRHSRLPVYEGSVDNIIGVLQIRRYMKAVMQSGSVPELRPLLDRPCFVHMSMKVDDLLPYMSANKVNLAVVSDNTGGTFGVVTVEDILEELVGDIWDEDDVVIERMSANADGSYSFAADVDVEEAFDFMDYADPEETDFAHQGLGEWAYEHFDLIPQSGDSFVYHDLTVRIERIRGRRIEQLRIVRADPTQTGGADA